jgi:GTP-binding protein Era
MPISDHVATAVREAVEEARGRIADARARGGHGQEVTLVAVTKTHGPEAVEAAWAAGVADVGENKVQEATSKQDALTAAGTKVILALNKIDGMRRDTLLALSHALFETGVYSEVYMISALSGDGVDDLKQRLARSMPAGHWLYPEDQSADVPMRVLAAEITREKVYLRVHEELPYSAAVETTAFEDKADGSARIEQIIYVERESQRPIILGKGGQTLKWIGQKSREELIELLDRPVHLFVTVKVDPKWQDSRALYAQFGLDFDV